MTVLILGGTSEASALAKACADAGLSGLLLSLAGRTSAPRAQPVPTRVGGFGGADGLIRFIRETGVSALVDATHPFAARISYNAALAVKETGVPALAYRRPEWPRQPGDRWVEVDSVAASVEALGAAPRRVFLTVGRLELAHFAAAPQHAYLVRTIEPVGDALPVPDLTVIEARGPFSEADESKTLADHRIELLVTKHSGGDATYGKIAAARALGLPVVMVRRPPPADMAATGALDEAVAFVAAHAGGSTERGV